MKLPIALTIAGSDSGGGAGIQADLKTFAAMGVHGTSAITAVTAQNTITVTEIYEIPVSVIRAQIDAVVDDLGVQAAKTGMLASAKIIEAVSAAIRDHGIDNLVVDPVMVAKGGARLLHNDAIAAMYTYLLPLAAVVTPNIPEAEVLLGRKISSMEDRRSAARDLVTLGPRAAVVKGGHAQGEAVDVYWDGVEMVELPGRRIDTKNTHGSGCAFSAAIAAGLAKGESPLSAVRAAKVFITHAIESSIDVGKGHGPVNPMFE
jgi:hydroxymethylpyrimidine/phosphomethylpyrimidine kinase